MEFLPEHWSIIKEYAGIYHITTKWDFTKLDNNQIQDIVTFIPGKHTLDHHNRIPFIWKHLNKSKLINVYLLYRNELDNNDSTKKATLSNI